MPAVEWTDAPGGEGSHQAIDPRNPAIVYSHGFYGNFTREDVAFSRAPRRPPAAAGASAAVSTPIRPNRGAGDPELRRAMDGARSSSRRTIRTRSTPAIST